MGLRLKIGEIATLLLVVAISAQGFELVTAQGNLRTRALGTTAVALIAFVIGIATAASSTAANGFAKWAGYLGL
jgi:hypothetical protein